MFEMEINYTISISEKNVVLSLVKKVDSNETVGSRNCASLFEILPKKSTLT